MVVGVGWTYNIFLFGTSAYIKEFTLYIVYLKDQVALGDTYTLRACVARLCGKNMESIIEFGQLYSAQHTSMSRLRDQKIERVSELLVESFQFRKLISITLDWRI
jgi:hypothetical protein